MTAIEIKSYDQEIQSMVDAGIEKDKSSLERYLSDGSLGLFLQNSLPDTEIGHLTHATIFGLFHSLKGTQINLIDKTIDYSKISINSLTHSNTDAIHQLKESSTAQVLAYLQRKNLLTLDPATTTQLSLGAGFGRNEEIGVWVRPTHPVNLENISLSSTILKPRKNILVDNNKKIAFEFEKTFHAKSVEFIVSKAIDFINSPQPSFIPSLVTMLRMSPDIFSNTSIFFNQLFKIIAEKTLLIITIGSGNESSKVDNFDHRLKKINEIQNYLQQKGQNPHLIDLTFGKPKNPLWGLNWYSHLATLICTLDKNSLT